MGAGRVQGRALLDRANGAHGALPGANVELLEQQHPGDQVTEAMARLEDLGSGNRSGPEQAQLSGCIR